MSEFKIGDRVVFRSRWSATPARVGRLVESDMPGNHPFGWVEDGWTDDRALAVQLDEIEHYIEPNPDPVNHPAHYTRFPVEVIDITEHLSFNLGNVVKYACRAGRKDGADPIEDLSKAAWYLTREVERLSKGA